MEIAEDRREVWVTGPSNLARAKALVALDWANIIDLR
jgi:hypothetical protein